MNEFQLAALTISDLKYLQASVAKAINAKLREEQTILRAVFVKERSTGVFDSLAKCNQELTRLNSAEFLHPPGIRKKKPQNLAPYLPALIAQDWYQLYCPTGSKDRFYVYAHVDPTKPVFVCDKESGGNYGGMPFYIGKGRLDRAFDLKRNQGHGKRLRALLALGYGPDSLVKVLVDDLPEHKAFEIEAKLIYFFGTIYQGFKGESHGAGKGCLLNLDTPPTPVFVGPMREMYTKKNWTAVAERV